MMSDRIPNASEPATYQEALRSPDRNQWKIAMENEMASMIENETWDLAEAPKDANIVKCRWVYMLKCDQDGAPTKHKARLVARGYSQIEGVD